MINLVLEGACCQETDLFGCFREFSSMQWADTWTWTRHFGVRGNHRVVQPIAGQVGVHVAEVPAALLGNDPLGAAIVGVHLCDEDIGM